MNQRGKTQRHRFGCLLSLKFGGGVVVAAPFYSPASRDENRRREEEGGAKAKTKALSMAKAFKPAPSSREAPVRTVGRAPRPVPAHPNAIDPVEETLDFLSIEICVVGSLNSLTWMVFLFHAPIERGMDASWRALSHASQIVAMFLVGAFCLWKRKRYWLALRKAPLGLLLRLLILWALMWLTVYEVAYGLNCALDFAPMNAWVAPVTRKIYEEPTGENSFASYYFIVRDWKNPGDTVCLQVQQDSYEKTAVGQTIRVKTHPGLWGAEWW